MDGCAIMSLPVPGTVPGTWPLATSTVESPRYEIRSQYLIKGLYCNYCSVEWFSDLKCFGYMHTSSKLLVYHGYRDLSTTAQAGRRR